MKARAAPPTFGPAQRFAACLFPATLALALASALPALQAAPAAAALEIASAAVGATLAPRGVPPRGANVAELPVRPAPAQP